MEDSRIDLTDFLSSGSSSTMSARMFCITVLFLLQGECKTDFGTNAESAFNKHPSAMKLNKILHKVKTKAGSSDFHSFVAGDAVKLGKYFFNFVFRNAAAII